MVYFKFRDVNKLPNIHFRKFFMLKLKAQSIFTCIDADTLRALNINTTKKSHFQFCIINDFQFQDMIFQWINYVICVIFIYGNCIRIAIIIIRDRYSFWIFLQFFFLPPTGTQFITTRKFMSDMLNMLYCISFTKIFWIFF